jgi:hypothetical protein
MKKKFQDLIQDELIRISGLYNIGKGLTGESYLVLEDINFIDRLSLQKLFKKRSCATLFAIFDTLKSVGLDKLVYIEHHVGHRSNEK